MIFLYLFQKSDRALSVKSFLFNDALFGMFNVKYLTVCEYLVRYMQPGGK